MTALGTSPRVRCPCREPGSDDDEVGVRLRGDPGDGPGRVASTGCVTTSTPPRPPRSQLRQQPVGRAGTGVGVAELGGQIGRRRLLAADGRDDVEGATGVRTTSRARRKARADALRVGGADDDVLKHARQLRVRSTEAPSSGVPRRCDSARSVRRTSTSASSGRSPWEAPRGRAARLLGESARAGSAADVEPMRRRSIPSDDDVRVVRAAASAIVCSRPVLGRGHRTSTVVGRSAGLG